MASTLPNPSANHNEIQSRLLGDSLRHHEETNIWSKNTDINTFRGNVETKDGFEKLHKGIDTGNKLLVQQNEETDNQTNSLARAFSSVTGVFERLGKSLRGASFSKMFDDFRVELGNTAAFMKTGGERFHTGMKELTNGIGFIGPLMNNLKSAMFKGIAIFNILAGTLTMFGGILNLLTFGILGNLVGGLRDFGGSLKEKAGKGLKSAKEKITSSMELGTFKQSREGAATNKSATELNALKKVDPSAEFASEVGDTTVNISGQSIQDIGSSINYYGEANANAEKRHKQKVADKEKELVEKRNKYNLVRDKRMFSEKRKEERKLFRLKIKNSLIEKKNIAKEYILRKAQEGKLFAIRMGQSILTGLVTMAPFLALLAVVGSITAAAVLFKDEAVTGITKAVQTIGKEIDNLFASLRNALVKMGILKPKVTPTPKPTVKPTTTTPKINQVKELVPGKDALKKVGGQVLKKIPIAGAGYETFADAKSNNEKLDLITAAYNNKTPVIDDGAGGLRPLTKEEFEGAIKANKANAAGSVGRGAGALGGAAAGAAIGSIIPGVGTLVGGVVGGLVGGIFGGRAGDKVATDIAGDMLGVDDPQGMIDALTSNIETNLSGDALANLKSDIDSSKITGGGDTVVNNVANTNNVNNQESMDVKIENGMDTQFSYSTNMA